MKIYNKVVLPLLLSVVIVGCGGGGQDSASNPTPTPTPVVNTAPSITSTSIDTATVGEAYSYTFTATDVDAADTLTMSATEPGALSWLTFDAVTGILSGTPASGNVAATSISITVNDGTEDITQTFTITVEDSTTEPEPEPEPEPTGEELLTNGDFENGIANWRADMGSVIDEQGNSIFEAIVETATTNIYDINQSNVFDIVESETYVLSYKAKASQARTLLAGLGLNSGNYFNISETVSLTTQWQTFTATVVADGIGGAGSRVLFDMGVEIGNVYLDDVSVKLADAVTPIEPPVEAPVEGYIFHSANDDSFPMDYWGDTWDTNTVYTDQPNDTTYAKALEISKSEKWGTLVAWGNEAENTIDISSYTHAKFKVKTDTFTQVEVFVQSHTLSASQITYNLSSGVDLGNGWFEVQVTLPVFTDMTWFALNFIGDAGKILLADVYFTTLATEPVEGPALAAPLPPAYTDNEVVVLYSDSLSQDSFIGVWNANWWNAPIYAEGNVNGDYFAKYQITAGGIAGGVTGLEFGFEIEPLDASTKTTFNFDLFVEPGISKIIVQLVSTDGGASYTINNPTAGTWSSYELLFSDLLDNDGSAMGVLNGGSLQSIGLQLYGEAGQAVYLDNLYFSGQSVFYDLAVSVTDNNNIALANALVSVGNVTATTNASGVATLNLPEGEHKIIVDANGFGVTQGNQRIAGGEASLALGVIPLNTGPSVSAPLPTESNDVFVLYSDVLTVDKAISYWSDNWWNAPRFSEITIADETIAKLQIIPEGIAGGVTGIQYGIEGGIVDVSTKTGLRFDIYATSGISKAVFQIVSSTGPGIYTMDSVSNEQWVTVELPFTALVDSTGNFNPALLTQLGIQLWGSTSDALYIYNIYFY
ncbi:MAG: putative Ig domain-containing protein [Alteromonadaceae bacterium]